MTTRQFEKATWEAVMEETTHTAQHGSVKWGDRCIPVDRFGDHSRLVIRPVKKGK